MHRKIQIEDSSIRDTEAAFVDMVKRHEALIYKVCLAFTRQRRDEVEDLKQDILCNLWHGYKGFRKESKEQKQAVAPYRRADSADGRVLYGRGGWSTAGQDV